ncbi:MAG: metal-dependent hydrolase [Rhodocyclales bacterium]|nr:MAG: metal-dependent hydrolase [Rhodocyclales bacterium]
MDPLTHGLLGAVAAKAVLGRRLGHAGWMIGAAAGMLPDVDFFIRSDADPLLNIEYHRQFTHSLAFAPIGGIIAALPWLTLRKFRIEWRSVLTAGLVGYATHGVLDACTTYGTHLAWPFSPERASWNLMTTIGPLFTLFLLLGLVFAALRRSRAPAILALTLCLAYVGTAAWQRDKAEAALERIAAGRGHAVARAEIFPTVGNPLVWRTLYRNGDALHADRVRVPLAGDAQWKAGPRMAQMDERDLTAAECADPRVRRDFQRFSYFSAGWVTRAPRDASVIADARYSLATDDFEPIWGVRFKPAQPVPTEWVARDRERKIPLGELWREITGRAEGYRPLPPARLEVARNDPPPQHLTADAASCTPSSGG